MPRSLLDSRTAVSFFYIPILTEDKSESPSGRNAYIENKSVYSPTFDSSTYRGWAGPSLSLLSEESATLHSVSSEDIVDVIPV